MLDQLRELETRAHYTILGRYFTCKGQLDVATTVKLYRYALRTKRGVQLLERFNQTIQALGKDKPLDIDGDIAIESLMSTLSDDVFPILDLITEIFEKHIKGEIEVL